MCWVCGWHLKIYSDAYALKNNSKHNFILQGLFIDILSHYRFLLAFVVFFSTKTNPKLLLIYIHRALDSLGSHVLQTASMIIIIALFLHTGILALGNTSVQT